MRFSANLNIMIKAVEEASIRTARDFSELEILQGNPKSASKYANSCYSRVKNFIFEDLTKMRPEYNIFASDGSSVINKENSEYSFSILPIDGLGNLSRAIPDFTIAIALNHHSEEKTESIACVIYKVIGSELYYSEKGFGSFLNSRKIKASNRNKQEDSIIACKHDDKIELNQKNVSYRNFGCKTLEIAYLAAGRIDLFTINQEASKNFEAFYLVTSQANAKIRNEQDITIIES